MCIYKEKLHKSLKHKHKQESCAIAEMTARCALYKWIVRVVAEIWPFEITQDGGAAILDLFEPETVPLDPTSPENPP